MARPPIRLVPDAISHDVDECIDTIRADVKAGKVKGIAYVLIYKGNDYITNTAGIAHTHNTLTKGMVGTLLTQLDMKEMGL